MHMEAIEFLPGESVDYAKNHFFRIEMSRQIHVQAAVLENRFVANIDRCMGCIQLLICVCVKELIKRL
jgi:hypothetical protein